MKCSSCSCGCKSVHLLMIFSVVALILSAIVSLFGVDLWLAGTQWILVSIVLAVYAVAASIHGKCGDGECACGPREEEESSEEEKEQE